MNSPIAGRSTVIQDAVTFVEKSSGEIASAPRPARKNKPINLAISSNPTVRKALSPEGGTRQFGLLPDQNLTNQNLANGESFTYSSITFVILALRVLMVSSPTCLFLPFRIASRCEIMSGRIHTFSGKETLHIDSTYWRIPSVAFQCLLSSAISSKPASANSWQICATASLSRPVYAIGSEF